MTNAERCDWLFSDLSSDLSRIRPELAGQILCPLCVQAFGRHALELKTDEGLTLEHIPPKRTGGKWTTLTCGRCNSTGGHALDAELINMQRVLDMYEMKGADIRGQTKLDAAKLPTVVSWANGGNFTQIRITGGRPDVVREFQDRLGSSGAGVSISIDLDNGYVDPQACRALVRIGYLAMFNHFGYDYVLSGAGAYVRELIDGLHDDELWKFLPAAKNPSFERPKGPPLLIAQFNEIAYLVKVNLPKWSERRFTVLLPASTLSRDQVLPAITELVLGSNGKRRTLRLGPAERLIGVDRTRTE